MKNRKANRTSGLEWVAIYKIEDGGTYSTDGLVFNAETFQYTEVYVSKKAYSNNTIDTDINKLSHAEIQLTVADLTAEEKALLKGSDNSKGGFVANIKDVQPSFGLIVKNTLVDGGSTYRIFKSVKLRTENETDETTKEDINLGNISLKGDAIPDSNGEVYRELTSTDKKLDADKLAKLETGFPTDWDFIKKA